MTIGKVRGKAAADQLGSMLFSRQVSGPRGVVKGTAKKIGSFAFENYGSHHSAYPHEYVTFACGIGMTQTEVDSVVSRLDRALKELSKKPAASSSAPAAGLETKVDVSLLPLLAQRFGNSLPPLSELDQATYQLISSTDPEILSRLFKNDVSVVKLWLQYLAQDAARGVLSNRKPHKPAPVVAVPAKKSALQFAPVVGLKSQVTETSDPNVLMRMLAQRFGKLLPPASELTANELKVVLSLPPDTLATALDNEKPAIVLWQQLLTKSSAPISVSAPASAAAAPAAAAPPTETKSPGILNLLAQRYGKLLPPSSELTSDEFSAIKSASADHLAKLFDSSVTVIEHWRSLVSADMSRKPAASPSSSRYSRTSIGSSPSAVSATNSNNAATPLSLLFQRYGKLLPPSFELSNADIAQLQATPADQLAQGFSSDVATIKLWQASLKPNK